MLTKVAKRAFSTVKFNFTGKVAIVTGASSGIGKAVAKGFGASGAKVVCADFDEKLGKETCEEIKKAGGDAIFVKTDVSKFEDNQKLVKATVDKYGRLDIAFNNAGIASNPIPLPDVPLEDWRRVIATDLDSVFYACKTQAPAMKASGGGAIINTASIAGLSAGPNLAPYAAAKHGVVGLTRAAANDLASWGIRVNALCPGVVVTPILGPFSKTKMFEDMAANALQKRFAPPEDLVPQVMLLASNEASAYTTGTTIVIDGGQTSHF